MSDTNSEKIIVSEHDDDVHELFFGVESKVRADNILQNNLTQFEWVVRNKMYPLFWGRNITGQNAITKEEVSFIHRQGCKIVLICNDDDKMLTEEQGAAFGESIVCLIAKIGVPVNTAIFMEIDETKEVYTSYMCGFAKTLLFHGLIPGFKANTDAKFSFDREYSRGMRIEPETFNKILIWAVSPTLEEYDRITTTHLIQPDYWEPFAPSGITRNDIAIWQYGKECHPIRDNFNNDTFFNINLLRNMEIFIENMF